MTSLINLATLTAWYWSMHAANAAASGIDLRSRHQDLSTDLSGEAVPEGILAEMVVPRQYRTAAVIDARIDPAVAATSCDIAARSDSVARGADSGIGGRATG